MKNCCKPGLTYKQNGRYYCTESQNTCPFQEHDEHPDQIYLLQPRNGEVQKAAKCRLMEIIERELGAEIEEYP